MTDTINWGAALALSCQLDDNVSQPYKDQPLAQNWARICKVGEEFGEVIDAWISHTMQNPRKFDQPRKNMDDVNNELADVVLTAVYCLIHLNQNDTITVAMIIKDRQRHQTERVGLEWPE